MHRANNVCHLPLTQPFRALHDSAHLSSGLPLFLTCLQALGLVHRVNEVCHLPPSTTFNLSPVLPLPFPAPFPCLQALGLVHSANEVCHLLPLSEFYNDAVNNEDFNIKEDFRRYGQ